MKIKFAPNGQELIISCDEHRVLDYTQEYLEPCPFCKRRDAVFVGDISTIKNELHISKIPVQFKQFAVCCNINKGGCGATSGYRQTIDDAISTWNLSSVKPQTFDLDKNI